MTEGSSKTSYLTDTVQQGSLLTTKLLFPRLQPDLVPRARLTQRIHEGVHRKLTLVSAPAGFGKTTVLAEWIHGSERPVAWIALDESDNDPVRFFGYLLAALHRIDARLGHTARAMLQAPQPPPLESLLTNIINDVAATSQPFILVLDDYHAINAAPIHDALTFLLDHLPPQMHVVIATRVDPPLPLAGLRASGQLTELRADDLRFTVEEATDFLNDVMGLTLSPADVDALGARTEGWIVGLRMAALSMRGRTDVSRFIEMFSGSHRFILDYLMEEILEQQPDDVREFLLQTSILERMTTALCDAVMERENSQCILESLESANLFLVPLDEERRWYRYHHLFADLLRQLLKREKKELVPELHRRAGGWYERTGRISEAVSYVIAAGEYEWAAELMEHAAWTVLMRGELTTVLGWLDRLPDDLMYSRPRLGFYKAWALAYTGELDAVEPCLQGLDTKQISGEIAAVRAHVAAVRGDVRGAVEFAQQASEYLPEDNLVLRGIIAETLGLAHHWSGQPAAASRAFGEAIRLSRAADQTYLKVTATAFLGRAQEMRGALSQAMETYREMLKLASRPGKRPIPFAGMAHVGMAGLLYEWNDLDGARRHATEGGALSAQGGFMPYQLASYVIRARVCLALGDYHGARDLIRKAEQWGRQCDYAYVLAMVAEVRSRLWLAQQDVAAASRWAREHRLTTSDNLNSAREVEQIAVTRALLAHGNIDEAVELLARLLEAADAAGRIASMIKVLVLQALACQAQDDSDQALFVLERALALAEPEGYVRTFADEGEPVAGLLRRVTVKDVTPTYLSKLLTAFEETDQPPSPLLEPLSERELEVLRLVADGLSNQEIANTLVIAVSTVKSHTHHIYGKLGVKSRTEAVARAQSLGML